MRELESIIISISIMISIRIHKTDKKILILAENIANQKFPRYFRVFFVQIIQGFIDAGKYYRISIKLLFIIIQHTSTYFYQ